MIILGIDPGHKTGLAVVDTKTQKVLWSKTVYGGWKERESLQGCIQEAGHQAYHFACDCTGMIGINKLYEPKDGGHIPVALVQVPTAKKMAFYKRYDKKGKEIDTKAQVAKNALISGWCAACAFHAVGNVKCIPSQSQRKKGMKMTAELFKLAHPEAGTTSGHVRDAAIMALGYNEIGV